MRKRVEDITNVNVLQLKVTLRKVSPPVWRRIHIRSDATLESLHRCLQTVFDWSDSHMHAFRSEMTVYGPAALADSVESIDERKVRLRDVFRRSGEWIRYEYDFGDGWVHQVLLECIVPFKFDQPYPWVLAGRRACPPDDVGGVWGYERFLTAMSNPRHHEHKEMLMWHGGPFDAAAFDATALNRALHRGSAPAPERLTTRSMRSTPASRGLQGKPRASGRARYRGR
jgi:hypothetical protein